MRADDALDQVVETLHHCLEKVLRGPGDHRHVFGGLAGEPNDKCRNSEAHEHGIGQPVKKRNALLVRKNGRSIERQDGRDEINGKHGSSSKNGFLQLWRFA